ncbi:MAG TPA: hypothetical protein VMU25_00925 [Candidatus Paceibacterota bacterium]|nr:hypothetical protein [Candidatus Paceibacterota bacterium]
MKKINWNNIVTGNSILVAIASWYTIYAAGLSLYYLDFRPLVLGMFAVIFLVITELIFGAFAA